MTTNSRPSRIIKIDKHTNKIALPTILLQTRNFNTIGKIGYSNLNFSFVANGIDEISFNVHKYVDGKKCPIWDDIIDLKIIEVEDYGRFEISVNYTDNTETTKVICGQSLEVELGQIGLYEFHVNDEDDVLSEKYKPTVFWNDNDKEYSLLHRVLADKAPHWSWGYVTPCITLEENGKSELSSTFQRTYTANGETIYDFLTGTVAEESNVIFVFDTFRRQISCYSLYDCVNPQTGEVVQGIGEDTNVLVSKKKLANEISISSNKDSVKNCFRIEGGDDIITDMVRAVNMTGSNYINIFSEFQLNDMSKELRDKLVEYQSKISNPSLQDEYYGENGIFTRICKAYEDLSYYESSMMPNVEIKTTTAEEQYNLVKQQLIDNHVGIYSFSSYNSTGFTGVTGNVEDIANVYVDARYKVTVSKAVSYSHAEGASTGVWTGNIKVTHVGDETNFYPKTDEQDITFDVIIEDDKTELLYTKQKIEIALSKGSMSDIDFDVAEMDEDEMREYFNLYSLNRLKSFAEGYNNCLSVLMQVGETTTSEVQSELYDKYVMRYRIITNPPTSDNPNPTLGVLEIRQAQVDAIYDEIDALENEQQNFQDDNDLNLEMFLGEDLYLEFCKYRREDTYSNSNYVSDGLSTAECIKKAKELIDVATKEAKKACMLQRTVSTSLNNLFALPEFEPLYDSFSLFNYIRVRTEDELLKLRLIGIEFNGDSIEEIDVTFSDQIESIDGSLSDAQSIYQQMSSVATSFPSTARQAKQGETANKQFIDIYEHGMNATKSMITNNDNNEVTITNAGLISKRMDDAGSYGDKQLRITGNGMYLTDDAWRTLKTAIGEVIYTHPITKEVVQGYGILTPTLIGNLIAGKQLFISNENGSVEITGDGIKITNGTITWGDDGVNAPEIKDISNLTESLNEVDLYLEQLDGRIQTFSQTTDPSTSWTTTDEKNKHIDDLWVNPDNGLTKQWTGTTWKLVTDENLKNLASSKAQIFTSQPTIPYYAGDLWVQGATGDIMHCKTTKTSGTFDSTHWVISSKYTNNDELHEFIDGEFADAMLDIGTKIDGKADTFYQSNSPHPEYTNIADNATYNIWEGDLWYDTDTGKTYIYQKEKMNNDKYNYKWQFMNVPEEVFDKIDGIRTIYTTLPLPTNTTANQGDLLIPDTGFTHGGVSYIAKKVYKYVGTSWIEIDYTNDDYAKEVEKSLNSYKEEVKEFQTDVNAALTGGKTTIGKDFVISPKIGGGYMYIKDGRTTNNTGISVEINPNGTSFTGHNSDYVFNVQKGNNVIMGVTNNGDGYFSGELSASKGSIGGWTINESALLKKDTNGDLLRLDANAKSIVSIKGENKAVITSGYIGFEKDNIKYTTLQTTYWKTQPTVYGVGINSEYASKFISFGNKKTENATSYTTSFLLNYGLNPDGYTEDVLIYGDTRTTGAMYLYNGSYINSSGTTYNGIHISDALKSPRIFAGNYVHGDYVLDVNGKSYFSNDIRFHGKILCGDSTTDGLWSTTENHLFSIGRFGVGGVTNANYMLYVHGNTYVDGTVTTSSGRLETVGHNLWSHEITWTSHGNARTDSSDNSSDYNLASVTWVLSKVDSDERVKTNFNELPSQIDSIFDALHPQQYEFNNILEKEGIYFGDTAQHIEEIFSNNGLDIKEYSIVRERTVNPFNGESNYIDPENEKYHYIDNNNILWLCVDQIQKLKKEIQELKGEKTNG